MHTVHEDKFISYSWTDWRTKLIYIFLDKIKKSLDRRENTEKEDKASSKKYKWENKEIMNEALPVNLGEHLEEPTKFTYKLSWIHNFLHYTNYRLQQEARNMMVNPNPVYENSPIFIRKFDNLNYRK